MEQMWNRAEMFQDRRQRPDPEKADQPGSPPPHPSCQLFFPPSGFESTSFCHFGAGGGTFICRIHISHLVFTLLFSSLLALYLKPSF